MNMTPEEINREIATECRWTRFGMSTGSLSSGKALLGNRESRLYGTPPEDKDKPEDGQRFEPVPDYYNDLNAMHEAEITLDEWSSYLGELWLIANPGRDRSPNHPQNFFTKCVVMASSQQRAEAFLRTVGKRMASAQSKEA